MPTTPTPTSSRYAMQRPIDGQYFDGDGWTGDPARAYRTPQRSEAVHLAAYLDRITPGWVRAVLISDEPHHQEHAMRTTRIELEGSAGHVAIERPRNSTTIRIDSILRDPIPGGEQAWKTWELPARISDDELFAVAEAVQRRCDGVAGTNSDIHDYLHELQRFQD